jgi:hypothetical protein
MNQRSLVAMPEEWLASARLPCDTGREGDRRDHYKKFKRTLPAAAGQDAVCR